MTQPDPIEPETVARLRAAVLILGRRLRHQAPGGEISATELSVLGRVVRIGPVTPGALARSEHVRPPSMTPIIERLESAGYLERQAHPDDRRQYLVAVTPLGKDFLAETRELRSRWLTDRLNQLEPADRAAVAAAVDALLHLAELP